MNRVGVSAPAEELFKKFGFTVEHVVKRAKAVLAGHPEEEKDAQKQVVAKGD
jgi:transketolase